MQVVAAAHGKLLSIFDGSTHYKLGQTLHAKRGGAAWAPLDACYFAFPNLQQVSFDTLALDSMFVQWTALNSESSRTPAVSHAWVQPQVWDSEACHTRQLEKEWL